VKVRDRICLAIGGAALLTSVLAVGGALRWTQSTVALLVAGALATQVLAKRRLERLSPLVALLGVAAVLTAIQLIPLPVGLLHVLDPVGTQLRADGAALAGTSPWHSISLDPPGTTRALLFFITLLGVAILSHRFAASERGRLVLLGAVAVTCGLAAVVTGVHTLLSADSLYGLYAPVHMGVDPPVFGPLLNPNHLGGLMAMGAVLSLGLAFYSRQRTQLRVLWIVIGVGCTVVAAASLSRGAIVGLGIGVFVAAGVLVAGKMSASERRHGRRIRNDLPIAIVVGLGIALALYMSAGNVASQLQQTSLYELSKPISKYAAWKSSLQLVRETPWVGVGRGAVEACLTRVHPGSAYYTFSHLENEYLSAVVEWGIPGALILGAVFAWCVLNALRRWRDGPLAAAALGALAMMMFQSSVDFGIEMLGIAVPLTIIASTVTLVPLRPEAGVRTAPIGRGLLILALVAGAWLVSRPFARSLQEDHDDLLAADPPKLGDVVRSLENHPLDYLGFGEAADLMSRDGNIHAVEYLNQALRLHPTHPGLHRLAARMLVGLKRYDQAAVEYSLAMNAEAAPSGLLTEIVTLVPNADDVAASIPVDYPFVDVMLHSLKDLKRQDVSEKWLWRVAQRPQHDLGVIDTLYDLAMARRDYPLAEKVAELRMNVSHTTTSRVKLVKVQFQLREFDTVLKELADVKDWTGRTDEKADAWLVLCDVYIEQHQWDPALECLHRVDASGLLPGRGEVNKRLQIVDEQRTYESKMEAIKAMEEALKKEPRK
jgi:O-antigen ligase/tetratricopeptide (TPR) repeat protein